MACRRSLIPLLSLLLLWIPSRAAEDTTQITAVTWDPSRHFVHVSLDSWPATWPGWKTYVDGVETSMEGEAGEPVIRPDAPLDQPPTGFVVGTLPWLTGLDSVDFPCCGTIQFYVPNQGLTNTYEFKLQDLGCATASTKACPLEWTTHDGDLVVEGTETRIIQDAKLIQRGNIYVRDTSTLVIKDSEVAIAQGAVPTVHVYIFVDPMASLVIEHSLIHPFVGDALVCVMNRGEVRMSESPTQIHLFDMSSAATFAMTNSRMVNTIGGLLQVAGGSTTVSDSTLGALGLRVPAGAHLNLTGLKSGVYLEHWDVRDMIPEADYDLILDRTTILKDDFTGELEHGPYERGWIFSLDADAHVRVSDSELRKIFIDIRNDTAAFHDLRVGVPSSLSYRDIVLTNVAVQGEWPFTVTDSDLTITNSDYLFLEPSGSSTVRIVNSHVVEFIPRNFSGVMIFENGLWTEAGEIIAGVPYHSMKNDFAIKGSLRMEGLREDLRWKDARVTREFEVVASDADGRPMTGVLVRVGGKTALSRTGNTKFNLVFNQENYNQPTMLEAWKSRRLFWRREIDFFTETPIRLREVEAQLPPGWVTNGGRNGLWLRGLRGGHGPARGDR